MAANTSHATLCAMGCCVGGQKPRSQRCGGLSTIVRSDKGPLALAGTVKGGRVFQLAFDRRFALRVPLPVLVLNTAGWLTEGGASSKNASSIKAGMPIARRVMTIAMNSTYEDRQVLCRPTCPRDCCVCKTDAVGFYEIRGDGRVERLAVNLASVVESNIEPRQSSLNMATPSNDQQANVLGRYELWRWLLLAALLMLLVEWLVWHRRRFI